MIDVLEVEQEERFKVTDLEGANWCLKKISAVQKDLKEKEILAATEKIKIEKWLEKESETANNSIDYFKSLLNEYLQELRRDNPKAKISTPYGTVSTRKTQVRWNYDDEKIKEFLKANNMLDCIRVKEELDKTALKKDLKIAGGNVVDEDGQIVEGITLEPSKEELTVKVVE
jgi:phage terminase small subunit